MSDSSPLGDRVTGACFPSFYVPDLPAAEAFYASVLGPTEFREGEDLVGFQLGSTWLTLFRLEIAPHPDAGGPRNAEFAIEVRTPRDVDRLYERFLEAGGTAVQGFGPKDTWMYRKMRFCCLDDPFGIRVDIFCPLPETEGSDEGADVS